MVLASGHLDAALPGIETAAVGSTQTAGQVGAGLPALDTDLSGTTSTAGVTTTALPGLMVALGGSVTTPVAATLVVVLPALTMASGRATWPPAVEDASPLTLVGVDGPHEVPWISVS